MGRVPRFMHSSVQSIMWSWFDHLAGLTELALRWLRLEVVSWSVGPADAWARWPSPTVQYEVRGCVSAHDVAGLPVRETSEGLTSLRSTGKTMPDTARRTIGLGAPDLCSRSSDCSLTLWVGPGPGPAWSRSPPPPAGCAHPASSAGS